MAKKWAISDEPPLKVRVVKEIEREDWGDVTDKPTRMRTIGRRIVKVLVTLWMLAVGAWLQAYHGNKMTADADGPHDAIDGQEDPFNAI